MLNIPPFKAIPFLKPGTAGDVIRLTETQRADLERIATRQKVKPRAVIYREGDESDCVFAIAEGAIKSYRELRSGRIVVSAFLFACDLFGLAANGRYVNTTQVLTPSTIYRLPVAELAELLKERGDLQFVFLSKVTHELRESQRRAVLLTRRDAVGRLAMFISQMGERLDHHGAGMVPLPMSRSDIAGYTGLSLESISRASADLQRRKLVTFDGRHLARILDPAGFARLTGAV